MDRIQTYHENVGVKPMIFKSKVINVSHILC